ncbi:hypothetical protein [Halapricum desulfuricans]|nr:hypothetical protein [Halapricum desulfuricans]
MAGFETHILQSILRQADQRSANKANCLSTKDVRYILTEDTSTYKKSELEDRIEDGLESLDERFQWLLNDIALLHYQGEVHATGEIWNSILETEGFARHLSEKKVTLSTEEINQPETKLGYDLGLVIAMMSDFAQNREEVLDLIWGFILAHSATESGQELDERKNLEAIFEGLENRKRDHYNYFISFESGVKEKENNVLTDVLSEFDLAYSDLLSGLVSSRAQRYMYENDVGKRQSIRSVVEGLLDNTSLDQAQKVRTKLDTEWDSLREASAPGVDAEEILISVWNKSQRNSGEIAIDLYKSSFKGNVTETLNKLAKDGKNRSRSVTAVYEHAPIVKWDNTEQYWVTTDYGDLLCYFRENDNIEWLHDYGINPEDDKLKDRKISQREWDLIQQGAEPLVEIL